MHPILCNPTDCSPWRSCIHGNSPGKNTGVCCRFCLWVLSGDEVLVWSCNPKWSLFQLAEVPVLSLPEPIPSWNMDIVEDIVKVVRCWMVGQRVSGSWKNICWPWSPWWLGCLRSGLHMCPLYLVFRRQVYFNAASQLWWLREAEALPGDWGWWRTITPRPGMAQGFRVIFCLSFSARPLWQSLCLLSEWSRNCPQWSGADKVDGVCKWRTWKGSRENEKG